MRRSAIGVAAAVLALSLGGCAQAGSTRHLAVERSAADAWPTPDLSSAIVIDHVPISDLQRGQCSDHLPGAEAPEGGVVTQLDCAAAHLSEVFAVADLGRGAFPGDERISEIADGACMQEFRAATGKAYEDSRYSYGWNPPSEDQWDREGGNAARCILIDANLDVLTGTALAHDG